MPFASVRALLRLFAVVGLLALAACQTTMMVPITPIPLRDPVEVEIDGEPVVLHHPYLEEGDLVGWQRRTRSDSTLVRVPYEQEVVVVNRNRTLVAGIGGFFLALLLVAIV